MDDFVPRDFGQNDSFSAVVGFNLPKRALSFSEVSAEELCQLNSKFQHITLKSFNQWLEEIRLIITPSLSF